MLSHVKLIFSANKMVMHVAFYSCKEIFVQGLFFFKNELNADKFKVMQL